MIDNFFKFKVSNCIGNDSKLHLTTLSKTRVLYFTYNKFLFIMSY